MDGERKTKSKLCNNERSFYFTFSSYVVNFHCKLGSQKNMYYLHDGNKVIQQKEKENSN